jgi:hypothetical protein
MRGKVLNQGNFELLRSPEGRLLLLINSVIKNDKYFWNVSGNYEYLIHTEGISERSGDTDFEVIRSGHFYLIELQDSPDYPDLPHLYLQDEHNNYEDFLLPDGLPDLLNPEKEIITTGTTVDQEELDTFAYNYELIEKTKHL